MDYKRESKSEVLHRTAQQKTLALLRVEVYEIINSETRMTNTYREKHARGTLLSSILTQCMKLIDLFDEKCEHADVILKIDGVLENRNSALTGHERILNGLENDNSGLQQEIIELRKRLQDQRSTNDDKQARQDSLKQNFVETETETKQLWANVERAKLNVKVVQEAMVEAETTLIQAMKDADKELLNTRV